MPESRVSTSVTRRPPLGDASAPRADAKSQPLTPGEVRSGAILHGQTALFHVEIPTTCQQLVVHLHKGSGDPLLMLRHGAPPRVPRRSRIVADFWDQEAFNGNGSDHHVAVDAQSGLLVPGTWYVGVANYNYHVRETCRYALTLSLSSSQRAHADLGPSLGARAPFAPDPSRDRMDADDGVFSAHEGARAQRHTPTRARPSRAEPLAARALDPPSALRTPRPRATPPAHGGFRHGDAYGAADDGGGVALLNPALYESHAPFESSPMPTVPYAARPAWADSTNPPELNARTARGGARAHAPELAAPALSLSMGVLADELARARAELAANARAERGRALVRLLGGGRQLALAVALGEWRVALEAQVAQRLARGAPAAERASELRALLDAQERRLADARAAASFAQEHAGQLSATLDREREARAADAAAEFELLAALLRARGDAEARYAAVLGTADAAGVHGDGESWSALLRLFAAIGGGASARELAELKARRWQLGVDGRLRRQANLLHAELGSARKADEAAEHEEAAAEQRALADEARATAHSLREELTAAHDDADRLRTRAEQLEAQLEKKFAELRELRQAVAVPAVERTAELASAEAAAVQRTVERELGAMDSLTLRLEQVVHAKLFAQPNRPLRAAAATVGAERGAYERGAYGAAGLGGAHACAYSPGVAGGRALASSPRPAVSPVLNRQHL
ncbi:hypothetical protein KFE25_001521 [Diacronema lutheri]|uniref:Uncharacterized protein n=1 Tax=Diacronema lutheri TaxID=2081491 RepID=A0A8J6C289_DIALT|nr:hypothetical protein KFE25_001521 [Diacronema lutheri]